VALKLGMTFSGQEQAAETELLLAAPETGSLAADSLQTVVAPTMQRVQETQPPMEAAFDAFKDYWRTNIKSQFAILLLQVISILIVARLFSFLFAKIGQPTVIGEILAGIALGPSLLGYFFPDVSHFLFSADSLHYIDILSKIGLILFMFVIGMELDLGVIKRRMGETFFISHANLLLPFILGIVLAYFVYQQPVFFNGMSIPPLHFYLFIAISMSITAFPVLARILREREMSRTGFGGLAMAAAANIDITAWCLLAVIIAIVQAGSFYSALYVVGATAVFVALMFLVIKPIMKRVSNSYLTQETISKPVVAFVFLMLIVSAFVTESLGIHALFGAFLIGVVMPTGSDFRKILTEKIEDVALVFLLPLFFVRSGLKIEFSAVQTADMWIWCGIFILVAVSSKVLSGVFATRLVGESWKNSWYIGALMNTRGLMELVVLNIGYELQVLPPPVYTILFMMTIVTTFMTGPLLSLIDRIFSDKKVLQTVPAGFRILLPFGQPEFGRRLLQIANIIFGKMGEELKITAFHSTEDTSLNPILAAEFERESFVPVLSEAKELNLSVNTEYRVTFNISQEIIALLKEETYDFLLMGSSTLAAEKEEPPLKNRFLRSIPLLGTVVKNLRKPEVLFFPEQLLSKNRTQTLIQETTCPMGIFIDRNFSEITNVIMPLLSPDDTFMLDYADKLLRSGISDITVIDSIGIFDIPANEKIFKTMRQQYGRHFLVLSGKSFTQEMMKNHSFMLTSLDSWNFATEHHKNVMTAMPSALILREAVERKSNETL
jgi:Kef-type K+ transport system membrane component KefB